MVNTMKGKNMKKLIALMLAFGVTAGIAHAQTQVLSQNAVGYVKTEVPAGGIAFVGMPFEELVEDGNLFGNALGDQLPIGTTVNWFDPVSQTFDSSTKSAKGWSGGGADRPLVRGEGFFLTHQAVDDVEVFLMGEVPDTAEELITILGGGALQALSFAYPAEIEFLDTELADVLATGDTVFFWSTDTQSYQSTTKSAKGWSGATGLVMQPGGAFFVQRDVGNVGSVDWTEAKPYTWP